MPYLSREGISLYHEWIEGPKRPVVLIHGWCCDRTFLAPQSEHFAAKGHAVITVDLRGHGLSEKPEQPYPIGAFSDDLAWLCQELDLLKPLLIGHSMGGIIAFDIAARWPDLPAAIAMIDSAVTRPASTRAAMAATVDLFRKPGYREELRRIMISGFFLPTDDPARRDQILATMVATPQYVIAGAYAGLFDFDATAFRGLIRVPALFIAANEPSPRSDLAALKDILPQMACGQTVGSGHFCQLEVPDQVNAMLDRFLALNVPDGAKAPWGQPFQASRSGL